MTSYARLHLGTAPDSWGDLRLIIEQDMYPASAGSAKAIAARTRDYFTSLGLPPAED